MNSHPIVPCLVSSKTGFSQCISLLVIFYRYADTMPVIGLPPRLEQALNMFMREMNVSSFKIDDSGNKAVVVLRLTSAASVACQPSTVTDNSVMYRRKSPSQIERDRTRAEQHRADTVRKTKASPSSSPSGLFLPTPPSLFYSAENATGSDTFPEYGHADSTGAGCVTPSARTTRTGDQADNMQLGDVDPEAVTVRLSELNEEKDTDDDKNFGAGCSESGVGPVSSEVTKTVGGRGMSATAMDLYRQIMDALKPDVSSSPGSGPDDDNDGPDENNHDSGPSKHREPMDAT